ncbi:MAG: nucleotide sugar dehydrogenase, partial [Polyangiaceae bacterium]
MSSHAFEMLASKITARDARVVVIGLGYIGLPLLAALAAAGFDVAGFDVDATRIAAIANGKSVIEGVDAAKIAALIKSREIKLDSDRKILTDADVVVLAIPTPVSESGEPDRQALNTAVADVALHTHSGMLVVLESTSQPGTTREIGARISAAGFHLGEDIFVAHSPERIDPGNERFGLKNTARIAGGLTADCTRMSVVFYKQFVDEVIAVSNADTAEFAKLFENTYRAVNIGLVNELAVASKKLGVDIWEVVEAAGTKPFGFMKFLPGPGVGGPCVPAAPRALSWKMSQFGDRARFMELAIEANRQMPVHVARLT